MQTVAAFIAAIACVCVIAAWVRRTYDTTHAVVLCLISAATLVCVWFGQEVRPIGTWSYGNFWRYLLIFSVPAVVGVILFSWQRTKHRDDLRPWLLMALFWLAMPVLMWITTQPVGGRNRELGHLTWWALSGILVYVSVPLLYGALTRERIREWGLSLKFIGTEARVFLLLVPVVAAVAWFVAADEAFASNYPFLRDNSGLIGLLAFEALYGLTFVALEFYFRGFMVHAGNKVIGAHAVPLMSMFYCFIHLGKPPTEVVASLVAGLTLGYLSLRLRSIAVGVALHLTMAWGVDAAVLLRGS